MNVSKGSIERGVKVRKRTERDHDGSDFVYPKQKKKSFQETIIQAKETILQAEAQITDPDFDTEPAAPNTSTHQKN